jgi:O-antigen/teichoic acid export membrane protein
MSTSDGMVPIPNPIMRNSALNAAAGMVLLGTGFISSVVVARLLGPEANGVIAFAIWLTGAGSLIAELGTGVTLQRILPQLRFGGYTDIERRGFSAVLAWAVTASTILLALGYALLAWYFEDLDWMDTAPAIVLVTGVLFVVQSVGSFSKNYLIGEQRLGAFFRLSTASAILQLLAVGIGAWYWGVLGALAGYVAGQILVFFSTLRILATRPRKCGVDIRLLATSSSIIMIEFVVTAVFLARPEIAFLQWFRDTETVGYYAVALSLANLALQLPIQLTGSLMPYYSSHLAANSGELPASIFRAVLRNFAYLTLPMSLGLAAVAEPLVMSIYGPAFKGSGIIVAILALGAPASVFLQLCTQYLFSLNRPGVRLHTAMLGAVVMVIGLLVVAPVYGGIGAAIVRNLVIVGMCFYMARHIKLAGSSRALVSSIVRIAAASLIMAAVAYLIAAQIHGIAGVIAAIVAGAAIYVPALRLLGAIDPADLNTLVAIGPRIPAALRPIYKLIVKIASPMGKQADGNI